MKENQSGFESNFKNNTETKKPPFSNDKEEINYLERVQTGGNTDGVIWNRDIHWPRLQELKNKEKGGMTDEQRSRFTELTKKQTNGDLTEEERAEIIYLYNLLGKDKKLNY